MPLDLPVEIWLEILSYLPQSFLYKLMGLNRVLFNLAMKHKYEEVRFMTDDKSQLKTFEKLRFVFCIFLETPGTLIYIV